MLKKIALVGALLAAPVAAMAEGGPKDNMFSALSACVVGLGDITAVDKAISGEFKWTQSASDETSTSYMPADGGSDTMLTIGADGKTCVVESNVVGVADAKVMIQAVMQAAGVKDEDVAGDKDEFGCDSIKLSNGDKVSVVSGGAEPTCDAADNSQVFLSRD